MFFEYYIALSNLVAGKARTRNDGKNASGNAGEHNGKCAGGDNGGRIRELTWESYQKDALPLYLLSTKGYGITVEDINWSCSADMEPYIAAYRLEKEQNAKKTDMQNWYMGQYVGSTIMSTIGNSSWFRGKHEKASEYVKEPFMQSLGEDYGLTQEEIDEREMRKMIVQEDAWCMQLKGKLPETKIM